VHSNDNKKSIYSKLLRNPWRYHRSPKNDDKLRQPCLPCTRVARFLLTQYTKTSENIPNYHNITKWPQNIPNDCEIFQMTIKYTSIFHSKALQNLPKLGFLV
jgi:hypothetical protein